MKNRHLVPLGALCPPVRLAAIPPSLALAAWATIVLAASITAVTAAGAAPANLAVPASSLAPVSASPAAESDAAAHPMADQLTRQVMRWAQDRTVDSVAALPPGARVEIVPGQLDPRLRLAPCARIEPYLPAGSRPWGRTRVGLRCVDGAARWNVYLPITVRVLAPAPVLREPLPAGTEITPAHLTEAEVDWADRPGAPVADPFVLVGRSLSRPMLAGTPVRDADLQRRQWFAAGDRVKVTALGRGYAVSTEGQALTRGLDGETVRVRTEGGRVVSGTAVGDRQVEIPL